jgi:predicted nucleic acid-binding Zn ribbon protein
LLAVSQKLQYIFCIKSKVVEGMDTVGKKGRKSPTGGAFHQIHQVLPSLFNKICKSYELRADLILAAWPEIIGPQFAPMTQATSFEEGILSVKVKNSTLYSLLVHNEKERLVKLLRKQFPQTPIKTIQFRMG